VLRQTGVLLGPTPPTCAYLEAYRSLRTTLLAMQAKDPFKSILVASARQGDGKTTVALNLATVLALGGAQVTLVDADTRRPQIEALLDPPPGPGLMGACRDDSPLSEAVVETELPRLKILPSGGRWDGESDLLTSSKTAGVLDALMAENDLVVVDSAPVLATADAAALSRMVDGVLFVVRARSRATGMEERALKGFADVGARVLGIVLNEVFPRDSAFYGQYYAYQGA